MMNCITKMYANCVKKNQEFYNLKLSNESTKTLDMQNRLICIKQSPLFYCFKNRVIIGQPF